MPQSSQADRKIIKKEYTQLRTAVLDILRSADPIGLIALGAPEDEYDLEGSMIIPRLSRANGIDDVQYIIHKEFAHHFGPRMAGPYDSYEIVSERVWEKWRESRLSSYRLN